MSIVDCTDFREQITQKFDQKEMLSFLVKANNYFSRIHPYLIYRNYRYFNPGNIYYVISLSNLINTTYEDLTNYERLSYFNELTVKIDQIKLGLMYGDLSKEERKLVKKSLKLIIDKNSYEDYILTKQGGKK